MIKKSRILSRWSPCNMICPFLLVPPHAQKVFSFCAMFAKFMFLSSMPSITVVGRPNFRVSSLTRILCCSFSISPQTHKSFGSPHVEQTSAMTLNNELASEIYKSFKKKVSCDFCFGESCDFSCFGMLMLLSCVVSFGFLSVCNWRRLH